MFENLHFENYKMDTSVVTELNPDDFRKYQADSLDGTERNSPYDIASFAYEGTADLLVLHPTSELIQQKMLYIQSFSLFNMRPSFFTERSGYRSYLLMYTYDGSGVLEYEGNTYKLKKDDAFLLDCCKYHRYHADPQGWTHSTLHFYGGCSEIIYTEFQKENATVFHCTNSGKYQALLEALLREYETPSIHRDFSASAGLIQLFTFLLENVRVQTDAVIPDQIQYLVKYIESNYSRQVSLDHLSNLFCLSKYHMSREFRKYIGQSPYEYLINIRLTHAKELLNSTSLPVYQIGRLVGIPNEVNFQRLFNKNVGMTPNAYRKLT